MPAEPFAEFFTLSDEALVAWGIVRRIADERSPGYPCRVSLTNSRPGDELLLVNYEHHPVESPYRMPFAIYVRKGEEQFDAVDRVPEQLRLRTLALRAFDAGAMMVGWELVDGRQIEEASLLAEFWPEIHPQSSTPVVSGEANATANVA